MSEKKSSKRSAKPTKEDSRPSKRPKVDLKEEGRSRTAKADTSKPDVGSKPDADPKDVPKPSALKSFSKTAEASFPRGGASVLTPLEHKQIAIEATQDALFEEAGAKPRKVVSDDEFEAGENDVQHKKSKKRRKTKDGEAEAEEKVEKIEGLSFKRLIPGSLVLGQITKITSRDIALALPNNLTGYVPLTAVSDQLTKRVEKMLADNEEADKSDDEDEDFEEIELKNLFTVGQYLRAYVTSNGTDVGGKHKRHIELSLQPQLVNKVLAPSDIVVNSMIQASVVSVEDHGLIMDLGIEDAESTKGFMGAKDVGAGIDHSKIQEGAVFLCLVTGFGANRKIVKLSADHSKAGNVKKTHFVTDAPTVNAFLPGTAVEVLLTDVTSFGITGKIMGMLDVTADQIHAGGAQGLTNFEKKFSIGSKIKARILFTFPKEDSEKVGISVVDHVLEFSSECLKNKQGVAPLDQLKLSSIVDDAKVVKVEAALGLFLDVGVPRVRAFAHISRLSEKKIDMLEQDSGLFKLGSTHKARVVGFNPIDGVFLVSLEQKVLDQPFLRIDDVPVGQIVKGTFERFVINPTNAQVGGMIMNLSDGISGLVPAMHMADVALMHPDRKYKPGQKLKARVLSTDLDKRLIRLSLKKTLVNSDAEPWTTYDNIKVGDKSPGTIIVVTQAGAKVQFYGRVRGWLPVAEMSEAFIKNPEEHFKPGQVVNVRVKTIDPVNREMKVSCKDPSIPGVDEKGILGKLQVGEMVEGTVASVGEKVIDLKLDSGVKAILAIGQLSDGSEKKNASTMESIRVGQKFQNLLVLEKLPQQNAVALSKKPSLIKAARKGTLLSSFEQVKPNTAFEGFVSNIDINGIFIQFAGGFSGLLPVGGMSDQMRLLESSDFGMWRGQSIRANVWRTDPAKKRVTLTVREEHMATKEKSSGPATVSRDLINPVDEVSATIDDFSFGKKTKAKIRKVLTNQINVFLADNVDGRIHVSEIYDDYNSIPNPKHPLSRFHNGVIVPVRIIGLHEARTQKYLPLSHRNAMHSVFECSAKKADVEDPKLLTIAQLEVGEERLAFISSMAGGHIFAEVGPNVEGVIDILDLVASSNNLQKEYPLGCALRVRVKNIDLEKNKAEFDVVGAKPGPKSFDDLKVGDVYTGRLTKVTDKDLCVRLSEKVNGFVPLVDIADDYDTVDTSKYDRNDVVKVAVVHIDTANKRVNLSMRPSLVLPSSKSPVKDRHIAKYSDLKAGDMVRGFVKTINDHGIFVWVGHNITAYIGYADVSDKFLKHWKEGYQIGQLVQGKIFSCDAENQKMKMTLKESIIKDASWQPPLTLADLSEGQIVDATVVRVVDFGVFVSIKNSRNVRGLCHRSEIADGKVTDFKKLFEEGDKVKAKIIKIVRGQTPNQNQINFSLKASHFADLVDEEDSEGDESDGGVPLEVGGAEDSDVEMDDEVDLGDVRDFHPEDDDSDDASEMDVDDKPTKPSVGLATAGFDWNGELDQEMGGVSEAEQAPSKKKKRRKAEIQVDKTGDLDKNGPQSVDDFERQLLGQPNSAGLWVAYMKFQEDLGEIEKARAILERALRTIHIREEDEKLDIWTAWLYLENAHGTQESLDSIFERACQNSNKALLFERLANIYSDPEVKKYKEAEDLYERMRKVRDISITPVFWVNYANFLMTTLDKADSARALLQRATQSLPTHEHRHIITLFGALEFKSPNGDIERGRTTFEGLVETYKKRWDIWDMYLDLELTKGKDHVAADKEKARALFARMTKESMRPRRAKYVFKRWLEFEEKEGNKKGIEKVKKLAREYVEAKEEALGQ
ncbi:rRNA biogenesis protein-like protein RRP5 [Venturia nashicola]|uniref:rRNA biogenesis protein RRP5 n=1 Tax=Venturia nashicola TaxID=86259 RepID=A0A4Z1PCI3_9PEZI|nr:rRNA biogenesis protein-like protein RRP5 [Venturia nashicola]